MSRDVTYLGIDTGATGAVAVGTVAGELEVFDLCPETIIIGGKRRSIVDVRPFVALLRPRLRTRRVACVELPLLQSQNGARSSAQTHATLGALYGALLALDVQVMLIEPQIWYRHHQLKGTSARGKRGATRAETDAAKTAAKTANADYASQLFPHLKPAFFPPAIVKLCKDGTPHKKQPKCEPAFDRADAALIWSYTAAVWS